MIDAHRTGLFCCASTVEQVGEKKAWFNSMKVQTLDILTFPYPVASESVVLSLYHDTCPVPKARARVGKSGGYTPLRTRNFESDLAWQFNDIMRGDLETGILGIRCLFYYNNMGGDTDNMLKAVSDAANGVVWEDDKQVHETYTRLWRGTEHPHSEILIYRLVE